MINTKSWHVLAALAAGLAAGAAAQWLDHPGVTGAVEGLEAVGGLWLNALRMTIVPLVFALLVTGIASVADAAATGRLAARTVGLFAVLLPFAAVYAVLASMGLLAIWPLDPAAGQALLVGVKGQAAQIPASPGFAEWVRALAPANPIQAAAETAILPLVVFGVFFGFAATRLEDGLKQPLLAFFRAISEAMITIVRWVLWAAPFGVFALSLGVGLRVGFGAAPMLLHYIVFVSLVTIGIIVISYLLPTVLSRQPFGAFAAATTPVLAVAVSTQSSLASLPVLVETARDNLGVPSRITGLVLPLAVAVFRITSPVANLAVAFFIAALYGLEPSIGQIAGAVVVSLAIAVGTVGLPGQVSFFASMAPICIALGVPVEILPILLAVEVAPDIFRTIGNVIADLAVAVIAHRRDKGVAQISPPAETL